jgi:hypothetical protein
LNPRRLHSSRRHHHVSRSIAARVASTTRALVGDDGSQYTEFAYSRLETQMAAGFERVEAKLDRAISSLRAGKRSKQR